MKNIFFITLLFIITFRPLLPIVSYTINYNKITSELCENKDNREILCNGFCFIKKEVNNKKSNASNEKYEKNTSTIYDAIVTIKQYIYSRVYFSYKKINVFEFYINKYSSELIKKIFHPPIL